MGDRMTNKIDYFLWCPICNEKTLNHFPPIALGIDTKRLKEIHTVIYEQICVKCFHNKDA